MPHKILNRKRMFLILLKTRVVCAAPLDVETLAIDYYGLGLGKILEARLDELDHHNYDDLAVCDRRPFYP